MKKTLLLLAIVLQWHVTPGVSARLRAETSGAQMVEKSVALENVIGEVIAFDKAAGTLTVKGDQGRVVAVQAEQDTPCLRVPPGDKDLSRAVAIQLASIEVGDRVLARGSMSENRNQMQARRLVILARAEVDNQAASKRAARNGQGVGGVVKAIDAQAREIGIEVRDGDGANRVVITTSKCAFHRYAPGSVRFADARPSSFDELKVGDLLRAWGQRSEDGKRLDAEVIAFGFFETLTGAVVEVDAQGKSIIVTTLASQRTVTIAVTKDSSIRRIPGEMSALIAKGVLDGRYGHNVTTPPGGSGDLKQVGTGSVRETGTSRTGKVSSLQQMIEELPNLGLADIKSGDVVAVTATSDGDKSHFTAVKIVAGVDVILKAINSASGKGSTVALSAGLPFEVFDFISGPP